MLENQDRDHGDQTKEKIPHVSKVGNCGAAASEEVDANGNQAQADGNDDGAGHDRGEEFAQGLDQETKAHLKDTADDAGTHNGAVGKNAGVDVRCNDACGNACQHTSGNGVIDADKAGRGPHNDGQPAADGTDGIELDKGDEAGDQHGVLQQRNPQIRKAVAVCQAAGPHNDQQRGQIADEHRQHMLQAQRDRLSQRDASVEGIGAGILWLV